MQKEGKNIHLKNKIKIKKKKNKKKKKTHKNEKISLPRYTRFLFNFTRFLFENCKLNEGSMVNFKFNTCQK